MNKTILHWKDQTRWLRRGAFALGGLAIVAAAAGAGLVGGSTSAHAQAQSCATAEFSAAAEASSGTAFVDVGAGKTATFVCIVSEGFTGGQSPVITANGAQAGGCFFVEGLGTSVVAVFWERPDIKPECKAVTSIKVGTAAAAATPTPTTPAATPTATQPSATATQPAATATPRPATPPATATPRPAATATPVVAPRPPATGSGTTDSSGMNTTMLLIAFGILAAGGLVLAGARKRGS